jgi:YVTN family beta-propeller protein
MAALALAGTAVALPAVLSSRGGGANAEPTLAIKVDSIARIDPARNKLVATIGSGSSHAGQVLAVGAGAVWVANRLRNEVVRIDPKANRVAKRIRANGSPGGLAFGGGSLWLVDNANGSVAQIDARRSSITHVIPLNGNASSGSIAVAGGSIWVDDGTPGRLVRIDPRSRAWTPVDLGGRRDCAPEDFVAQLAGGRGAVWALDYDPCHTASGLLRIDPRDNAVVPVPEPEPQRSDWGNQSRLAAAASGIWITHNPAGLVLRIDPTTERVTRTIKVGTFPVGVAVGAGAVWVANRDDGTVSRIDPGTNLVTATIQLGFNPDGITVDDDSVWVTVGKGDFPEL